MARADADASSQPEVIAIFGPTGIGKTEIALALAASLRARGTRPVAVSADALQVYEGLEILTSVPGPEQRAALEHRLISFLPLDASFSAGQYAGLAHAEIDGLLEEGASPIVVGGTGLYLRAALTDLDLRPPPLPGVRERWLEELQSLGAPGLHALLAERAPWAAQGIDPGDRQRIVRALELLDAGELEPQQGPSQLWTAHTRRLTALFGLIMERDALYERIDARVDRMLEEGVREEVQEAHMAGASETVRKALGFQELLGGDIEAMKRHTRNYARRQLTWMRKLAGINVIEVTGRDHGAIAEEILDSRAR